MWASVTITALRNPEGELLGFAKVTRDLTERRQAEETRRALAAEKAALAEKAKIQQFQERFLAILGHDLRNPLASINIGAGVLLQRTTDPVHLRVVNRMRDSSQRMSRMIEQILDLTRTRLAAGIELSLEPFDLRDTIRRVVEELRVAHPSRSVTVVSPPLPGKWDKDRLEQVFSNLVGNALAYGDPAKPVVVQARVEGRFIVIDVHSPGMATCLSSATCTTKVRRYRTTFGPRSSIPFDGDSKTATLRSGQVSAWVSTSRKK